MSPSDETDPPVFGVRCTIAEAKSGKLVGLTYRNVLDPRFVVPVTDADREAMRQIAMRAEGEIRRYLEGRRR